MVTLDGSKCWFLNGYTNKTTCTQQEAQRSIRCAQCEINFPDKVEKAITFIRSVWDEVFSDEKTAPANPVHASSPATGASAASSNPEFGRVWCIY